jgi:glutamate--cysteine ligase
MLPGFMSEAQTTLLPPLTGDNIPRKTGIMITNAPLAMPMHPDSSDEAENPVIENKAQLVEYLAAGCKSPDLFRLGAEQEMFVFSGDDYQPADYDGPEPGIKALLKRLVKFGWNLIFENDHPIALNRGASSITLEPGGQIELSGAPLQNAHQVWGETQSYHRELATLADELGLSFLAIGHQPKHSRQQIPWMPKQRYEIMRAWMPQRGSLGLDMMQRTSSMQVNVDFSSESDMAKKFRVALALQPIATALFANSPSDLRGVNGYKSYRSKIWEDTDPDRCGSLPFVFESGMGFERYTDYALDVPMYFVHREGRCIDASGLSFREFLDGRLSILPGQRPLLTDWVDHLSTLFPQVRLKQYLEMRGADAGDATSRVPALTALWAGILYDRQSLDAAWERIGDWTLEERRSLESGVAKHGFSTPFRNESVQELALWMLDLARQGLERRNIRNHEGADESRYLVPLQNAAETGQTFAEALVQRYSGQWRENIDTALAAMCRETFS